MTDLQPLRRPCFGCQVFDDHPRHEIADPESGADALGGPMHMDCCVIHRGCDVCKAVLERAYGLAGGGATGGELRSALEQLPPMQITHHPDDFFTATVTELSDDEVAALRG
jgi:hypothetical protein